MTLATDVLFVVSQVPRHTPRRWDKSEREMHPVEYLGRVLQTQHQPLPKISLAECLAQKGSGPGGQVWRRAATDAVLAHHEWSRLDALDQRLGSEAWTAVHEVAQFTHALSLLDEGLAVCCHTAGRHDDAAALLDAAPRLRGAAVPVVALAGSGPLPVLRTRTPPVARAALIIRRPEHLPAALERLTHLVRTAEQVSPAHVQFAYRLLGRVSGDACTALSSTEQLTLPATTPSGASSSAATLGDVAVEFSRALHRAGRQPGRASTVEASDSAVLVQLQLIATLSAAEPSARGLLWARGTPGRARQAAMELLRASTSTADALSEVTVRCLEDRKWLVPAGFGGAAELTWVPSWPHQADAVNPDAPPLLAAGLDARRLGEVVADRLTTELPQTVAAAAGRSRPPADKRLGAALLSAERQAAPMAMRASELRLRPGR
ncbi:hypothetical protein FHN55_12405 [Streptomyces sp. NP160]|uniref:hypothetical protein n=1 Tax=Streptomyces sp. NP160 TaxID=2586637 RepID=UPI00111B0812|nr:hypothetical protein [Streptomyces sp. NP160]TNM66897.1 hypothetical protein FHN55_12405 [Streptomyces sp. NP160]